MGLKSPAKYVQSLRDGRVTFWDVERLDDITTHPRFKIPIANTAADDAYDIRSAAACSPGTTWGPPDGPR